MRRRRYTWRRALVVAWDVVLWIGLVVVTIVALSGTRQGPPVAPTPPDPAARPPATHESPLMPGAARPFQGEDGPRTHQRKEVA